MPGTPAPHIARRRAKVAGLTNRRGADAPETIEAKGDLAVALLADHIKNVLAKAPPLTEEQRTALGELLRPVRIHPDARKVAVASALDALDEGTGA